MLESIVSMNRVEVIEDLQLNINVNIVQSFMIAKIIILRLRRPKR